MNGESADVGMMVDGKFSGDGSFSSWSDIEYFEDTAMDHSLFLHTQFARCFPIFGQQTKKN